MISLIQPSQWWVQGRGELLEVRYRAPCLVMEAAAAILVATWPKGARRMKMGAGEGRENRRVSRKFLPMAWGWLQDGPRRQHGCQQTPEPGLTEAKEEEQTLRTL